MKPGEIYTTEICEDEILSMTKWLRMAGYSNITWHRTETGFIEY